MLKILKDKLSTLLNVEKHIAPLVVLRITFGAMMFISILRFVAKGWVRDFYIDPQFHFTFYGFDWIKPLGELGMYALFFLMAIASLFIMLGFFYRLSIVSFFLSFSYVELIDKTYYLNHYYLISIIAFLLMLVPAHRYFSVAVARKPSLKLTHVPSWTITIFKFQFVLVYFFAGLSKLTSDWLFDAMPLKIWLPTNAHLPLIGPLMDKEWLAYVFSWFGMLFDLSIGFLLLNASTRRVAYFLVIIFHLCTGIFFKIGMFPYIMILMTLIFFSEKFHIALIRMGNNFFSRFNRFDKTQTETPVFYRIHPLKVKVLTLVLGVFFLLQLAIPFRYLLYPGKLYWTEEGYRFSWRVMLMEKGGIAFFYVKDTMSGRTYEVINSDFLSATQERMMTTQPDMMLQYAHFLKSEYAKKGLENMAVTVESFVTLNGSGSRPFIDKNIDLAKEKEGFSHNTWVLPFKTNLDQ